MSQYNGEPLEILRSAFPNAKPSGNSGREYKDHCPSHPDRHPSFTFGVDELGKGWVKCWSGEGCTTESILAAKGLKRSDILPRVGVGSPQQSDWAVRSAKPKPKDEKPKKFFRSFEDALDCWTYRPGGVLSRFDYHDMAGTLVGIVLRWDYLGTDKDKGILPVSLIGGQWTDQAMPDPQPLYGLCDVAGAKVVIVCEGEKCAEKFRVLGFTPVNGYAVVTNAGGSSACAKADWSVLAGKVVWIFPDYDKPGRDYATKIRNRIVALDPPATVRVVELPGLPDKGDIVDWVEAQGESAEPDALRAEIMRLAELASSHHAGEEEQQDAGDDAVGDDLLEFKPFPVCDLPEPLRSFVASAAKSIKCDPSFLALPLLVTAAGAIGNKRRLRLKNGWHAITTLWGVVVANSGEQKTPAFKTATAPIASRQFKASKLFKEEMARHDQELADWESSKAKQNQAAGPAAPKPTPPVHTRYLVKDTTIEALAPILESNPQGVTIAVDELDSWFSSFDRYAKSPGKSGGSGESRWLGLFNGDDLVIDRRSNEVPIMAKQATVSVVGGIQPEVFWRAMTKERRQSGLAARLLIANPPEGAVKQWTEDDIDLALQADVTLVFDKLIELQFGRDEDGDPAPILVEMSASAKVAWVEYYNAHNLERRELSQHLRSAWSKLEEYAARIALVVHMLRWANDPSIDPMLVDEETMWSAIRLTQWFKHEARRCYAIQDGVEAESSRERLLAWIRNNGGAATPREVQQGCRWLKEKGAALKALEELVAAGYGVWETTGKATRFVLSC